MDFMAFDGLRARYVHRLGVGAEAYGGLWVKGGSLLGSATFQPDGTRESDLARQAAASAANLSDLEPLYGAKLLLENLGGYSASVGHRKSLLAGKTDLERAARWGPRCAAARFTACWTSPGGKGSAGASCGST